MYDMVISFYFKQNIYQEQFKAKGFQIEMYMYKLTQPGFKNFFQAIKEILFFKLCQDLILKQETIINKHLNFLKNNMEINKKIKIEILKIQKKNNQCQYLRI